MAAQRRRQPLGEPSKSRWRRMAQRMTGRHGPRALLLLLLVALALFGMICSTMLASPPPRVEVEVEVAVETRRKGRLELQLSDPMPKRVRIKAGQVDLLHEKLLPLDLRPRGQWRGVSAKKRAAVRAEMDRDIAGFLSGFRDFEAVLVFLEAFGEKYAKQVEVGSVGSSFEGRPIVGVRLAARAGPNANPNVVVIGTEHGREHMVPMALCAALEALIRPHDDAAGFGMGTVAGGVDAAQILRYANVLVVPVVNPDGYAYTFTGSDAAGASEESKQRRFWRKNRQPNEDGSIGVDLNRNWGSRGFTWGHGQTWTASEVYMGPAPFSAPETQALRDLIVGDPRMAKDARVQRAKRQGVALHSLASGLVAVHCCIGGVLQPRNYCTVAPEAERLHTAMGKAMCKHMNEVGHGHYGFKPRRKTLEISSSGISIDWAWYDGLVPYPLMVETSPRRVGVEDDAEEASDGADEDADEHKSVAQQRKERLRAKMAGDQGEDVLFVGRELARAVAVHAGAVSGALSFRESGAAAAAAGAAAAEALRASPWGFGPDAFSCREAGKPDLVPADPCAKNKLKPWIKCNKPSPSSGGRGRRRKK